MTRLEEAHRLVEMDNLKESIKTSIQALRGDTKSENFCISIGPDTFHHGNIAAIHTSRSRLLFMLEHHLWYLTEEIDRIETKKERS